MRLVYNSANLYTYLAHIDTQLERIHVCDVDIMQKRASDRSTKTSFYSCMHVNAPI